MPPFVSEKICSIWHWSDHLFSFRTTRSPGFRFRSGQFVMLGLTVGERRIARAYSIASPVYADELEFFSVKVPHGPLTPRLAHLQAGDAVWVGQKPTGTLLLDALRPGRRLLLLATGTGLAPFVSLIQDQEIWERFATVVLFHGVRFVTELAYRDFITQALSQNPLVGEAVRRGLHYYPAVTREPFANAGRSTDLLENGRMLADLGLAPLDPANDRVMLCGNPGMVVEGAALLERRGFRPAYPYAGQAGDYVVERAFVDK